MGLRRWQKYLLEPYNLLIENVMKERFDDTHCPELKQVEEKSRLRVDMASHLRPIFLETVESNPNLIVELGTKTGMSTFALSRAAMVTGATLLSVDFRDCSDALDWDKWNFVHMDDVAFSKQFPEWASERDIKPSIDVLFIDTSHEYNHTKNEIAVYEPFFSKDVKVIFHDSNCSGWYIRKNFTIDKSYDCKRGVIHALEDFFGTSFNEKREFVEIRNGWLIKHNPKCNGLFIMKRIENQSE